MAITECKVRSMPSAKFGLRNQHTLNVVYRVHSDLPEVNPYSVVAQAQAHGDTPLPNLYELYTYRSVVYPVYVLELSPRRVDRSHKVWDIGVRCGPLPEGEQPPDENNPTDDPLKRPVRRWLEFQTMQTIVEADKDGNPHVNSAGEEFVNPVVADDFVSVLVCEKNYADYEEVWDLASDFRRTVNSKKFHNRAIGHVKWLVPSLSGIQYEGEHKYYTAELRFALAPGKDWKEYRVDRGYNELIGGKLREIRRDGVPLSRPALLNGAGGLLPQGQIGVEIGFDYFTPKDYDKLKV